MSSHKALQFTYTAEQALADAAREPESGFISARPGREETAPRLEDDMTKSLTQRMNEATHVYVGAAECGCRVAVVMDTNDGDTAESVAEFVRVGYSVTHETMDQYLANPLRLKCKAHIAAAQRW